MQTYTVSDYEKLSGEDRWELIKGVFHMFMSPSPQRTHQRISLNLSVELGGIYKNKKCEVYAAPTDVELAPDTVVQPDLLIVCDLDKMTEQRCAGSPDLIIEILSKSSMKRDCVEKLHLYEEFGVREYWIVNPERKSVLVYILENGEYAEPVTYKKDGKITLSIDPDATVDLADIFV